MPRAPSLAGATGLKYLNGMLAAIAKLWAEFQAAILAAAFFLLALAAQVSGIIDGTFALFLYTIGALLLVMGLWAYDPTLGIIGGICALAVLLWFAREHISELWSRFPWRLRLVRTDQADHPAPAQAVTTSDLFGKTQRGEWRISYAQPHNAEQMAKFILRADALKEEKVESDEQFEAWRAKYRDWVDEVSAALGRIKATEAMFFREGLEVPLLLCTRYPSAYNEEHMRILNSLHKAKKDLRFKQAQFSD